MDDRPSRVPSAYAITDPCQTCPRVPGNTDAAPGPCCADDRPEWRAARERTPEEARALRARGTHG